MKKQKLFEFDQIHDEREFNTSILSGLVVGMITTLTQGIYYVLKGDDKVGERVFMYSTAVILIIMYFVWRDYKKNRKAIDETNSAKKKQSK